MSIRRAAQSRVLRSSGPRRPPSRTTSSSRPAPALRRLDRRAFFRGVAERVREANADYPGLHSVAWSNMAQLWSGNKQLHYEAWIRDRLGVIELGLHFEADVLTNARLLAAFRARERVFRRVLGPDARVESWDKGWARVWEPIPLAALDTAFQDVISGRLARYVAALEPVLREEIPSDLAWTEPRPRR